MTEGGIRLQSEGKKQPKLSIITVVYNAVSLIPGFMENVLAYRSANVELVMLDGGSTDGTLELLQQYSNKIDYWRSEPDEGIYDAMNKAVEYTRGQWVYFMGADDRLLGGFNKVVNALRNSHVVYYAKVVLWGDIRGKAYKKYDFIKMEICHQSIFYPKKVFDYYQYETHYKILADQHFNIRCFADKRFKWQFLDDLVAIYDTRGFSANKVDTLYYQHYNHMVKKYLGLWVYTRYRFRKYKLMRKQNKQNGKGSL
ncbi:glycosyltransferase family 2 protein [Mucilaginibacter agri]|uniref:Glycosyltransferase n=1 Tax=Mucilaginibacter agri TaxID=2695265 RepID=A0A965ZGP5_9SPHI|nr:glycosyltransferase family 2 protein [Mucilaginibacter agri]NCD70355.1 glycosyltransferase [Mucilaginibacter agri]